MGLDFLEQLTLGGDDVLEDRLEVGLGGGVASCGVGEEGGTSVGL